MAKYYGNIGYIKTVKNPPGVWQEVPFERPYFGDVIRNTKRWQQQSEGVNDDILVSNSISIVADPYAFENYQYIRYCQWNGTYWKVNDIEVNYPRLILSIGGVYNGEKAGTTQQTPCPCEC